MKSTLPGFKIANYVKPNSAVQSVGSRIADPKVISLIPDRPYTFLEIDCLWRLIMKYFLQSFSSLS